MPPDSPEEAIVIPETDYAKQEDIDDLYGNGLEYDILYDKFGNISESGPIDYPEGMGPESF